MNSRNRTDSLIIDRPPMPATDFDFDDPNLAHEEEFPEFDDEGGDDVLDEIVDEDGVVDDDPDDILQGMSVEEIVEALDEEFGVKASTDADRKELADQLISLREEEIEEEMSENGEADDEEEEEDVEVDWVEGDGFEGEEEGDVMADEEEDEEDLSQSLKSALKSQDINPSDIDTDWAVSELEDMEEGVTSHKEEVMLLRWKQGLITAATPVKWGEGTMEKLSNATGVHENTLREAKRLVKEFNYNVSEFKNWIKEPDDGIRPWYEVRDLLNEETPQPDDDEEDQERKRNKLKKKVETLAADLEKVNGMLDDADEEERREVKGLTQQALTEMRKFMNSQFFEDGEHDQGEDPIPRSDEYLEFIREFPDPINRKPSHDPAHTSGKKGTGVKSSDLSAIPLTRTHHNELDENGQEWFEQQYDVSIDRLVKNYQHRFLTGQWLDMELPTPQDL